MNLEFMGKYEEKDEDLSFISFWFEPTRYDFEITWNEKTENIELIEREFKLNVKSQIEGSSFRGLKNEN